jgi:hypothetical protein
MSLLGPAWVGVPPCRAFHPTVARSGVDDTVTDIDLAAAEEAPTTAATAKLVADKRARIEELAEWDHLDRSQRRALGVPVSDTEWAKVKGLNVRRVAKYRNDPYYAVCVDKLRNITKKRIAPGGSASLADIASLNGAPGVDDLADYTAIKGQVAALARQGEQKALDLWLKHWGRPFLDEETANRVADLASMSDEELVRVLVEMVNPALLSSVLEVNGWGVQTPDTCAAQTNADGAGV